MALELELAIYKLCKDEFIKAGHEDKYVLIFGWTVLSFYPDQESAVRDGYAIAGLEKAFFVHQILKEEPVFYFSRNVGQ